MCGLCGVIRGPRATGAPLYDIFTRLLLYSEHRGPHATGAAWVSADGRYEVLKRPQPARRFIRTAGYAGLLNSAGEDATLLMGHTRWPTQGSTGNPANNHPLEVPERLLLAHNGHLTGVDGLFRRWRLPRTAEVDSELLLRLVDRHLSRRGTLDLGGLLADLAQVDGKLTTVAVSPLRPGIVYLIKRDMPLTVWRRVDGQALAYASEARTLACAAQDADEWIPVAIDYGETLRIDAATMTIDRYAI